MSLIGGLGLFLYGMQIASDGLQRAADARLKSILEVLTNNKIVAVLLGTVITVLLQSSGATTVMLVGLVSASLMGLDQTIGVMLGAGLGTTLTVQLIAFNATDYSLLFIGLGSLMILAAGSSRRSGNKQRVLIIKYVGQVVLGFGLIFFGMHIMTQALTPLRSNSYFIQVLLDLEDKPVLGVLAATVFTGIIHSSAATIGLTLSLANQGLITLDSAIPLVLGANIGTCVTALLSCLGTTREAQRVAFLHIFTKTSGALLCLLFMPVFVDLIGLTATSLSREIANAHTIFNTLLIFIFLPLSSHLARFAVRLLPDRAADAGLSQSLYLDDRLLDTPALALVQATKETVRLGEIIQGMIQEVMKLFTAKDRRIMIEILQKEEEVDKLSAQISKYLTALAGHNMTPEESQKDITLLYVVNDLEHIGDVVENLAHLAEKKLHLNLDFSAEGKEELFHLHELVSTQLKNVLTAFTSDNKELAETALDQWMVIRNLERYLRMSHVKRLHEGKGLSQNSSIIHLDLINYLQQVADHSASISYTVLGRLESPVFTEKPGDNQSLVPGFSTGSFSSSEYSGSKIR